MTEAEKVGLLGLRHIYVHVNEWKLEMFECLFGYQRILLKNKNSCKLFYRHKKDAGT